MTNEEAIKHFKSLQKRYTKEHNGRMCEKVNLALEALEKQIPKKPTHTYKRCGFTVEGCCPICGEAVVFGQGCSNNECGQAIDWSDDE